MKNYTKRLLSVSIGVLLVVGCSDRESGPTDVPQFNHTNMGAEHIGRAVVVLADVPAINTNVKLMEAVLPKAGGTAQASVLSLTTAGLLTAGVAEAFTEGVNTRTTSRASVANLLLTVGGHVIQAAVLESTATATCPPVQTSGSSVIAQLVIDGTPVTVSGQPNQTISLGVGQVVINEHKTTPNTRTVNALHVEIPGVADVIISSAKAGVSC